jgi:hypothetical protein
LAVVRAVIDTPPPPVTANAVSCAAAAVNVSPLPTVKANLPKSVDACYVSAAATVNVPFRLVLVILD